MIDNERFLNALSRVTGEEAGRGGIGTLSERSLHRTLKYYFEPDSKYHEVEHLGSVADIKSGEGITEIQTGSFRNLCPKLERFLKEDDVTVVYPLVVKKKVKWLDKETGELTDSGRELRGKVLQDCGKELFAISRYIGNPKLTVKVVMLSASDYRYLDGYDKTRKKRATKINTLPEALLSELVLKDKADYLALLPEGLDDSFSAKDFTAKSKSRSRYSYYTLRLLLELGLLERFLDGREYKYVKIKKKGQ